MRDAHCDLRRGDGIAHGIHFVRGKIGGRGGGDGRLEPLGSQHFFKGGANVFVDSAVGWNLAVIERNQAVDFGVEVRTGYEGKILEARGAEIGGRHEHEGQIQTVEFEGHAGEHA